jgi:hypothetical protein
MARTTATLKTLRRANDHEVIDDPSLRTHVNVDAAQALCPPGQPVVRQFWCAQVQPHVTGPGAFVPTVMADGSDARLKAYGARHAHDCGSRPEARHQCEARAGAYAVRSAPGHEAWPGLADDRAGAGTDAPALGWLATRAEAQG